MVNICFITDENYVLTTMVAIKSLITNSKSELTINVVTPGLCDNSQKLFKQLETKNSHINIIEVVNPYENLNINHPYISNTVILKFMLPDIFKDLDKILYLDGDMIVSGDLTELYNTDLEDNYVGAVVDVNICKVETLYKEEGLEKYFNAGVMLMNLAKIRNDNILDTLVNYLKNEKYQKYLEQDSFNFTFREKVKWLPLKYNFFDFIYNYELIKSYLNITNEEYNDIVNSVTIHHYAGVIMDRIFEMLSIEDFRFWYKYFRMLPESSFKTDKALDYLMRYQFKNNDILNELAAKTDNIQKLTSSYNHLENQYQELSSQIKNIRDEKQTFLQKLFSVRNRNGHKVLTILGIKMKFKRKKEG